MMEVVQRAAHTMRWPTVAARRAGVGTEGATVVPHAAGEQLVVQRRVDVA